MAEKERDLVAQTPGCYSHLDAMTEAVHPPRHVVMNCNGRWLCLGVSPVKVGSAR
jgi:hypothetical protein